MNELERNLFLEMLKTAASGGAHKIEIERLEHFSKHQRSVVHDVFHNPTGELITGAKALLLTESRTNAFPTSWGIAACRKMAQKPYKERLIIAGALIAAEIDRLEYLEKQTSEILKNE